MISLQRAVDNTQHLSSYDLGNWKDFGFTLLVFFTLCNSFLTGERSPKPQHRQPVVWQPNSLWVIKGSEFICWGLPTGFALTSRICSGSCLISLKIIDARSPITCCNIHLNPYFGNFKHEHFLPKAYTMNINHVIILHKPANEEGHVSNAHTNELCNLCE